jgi:hypothetical protein
VIPITLSRCFIIILFRLYVLYPKKIFFYIILLIDIDFSRSQDKKKNSIKKAINKYPSLKQIKTKAIIKYILKKKQKTKYLSPIGER